MAKRSSIGDFLLAGLGTSACVAGLAALIKGCSPASPDRRARPNVLLITLDTTRADALGAYGNPRATTPHLDRIASEGTRFDLAISTAAVTPVSHASILTGLDNKDHGLRVMSAESGFRLAQDVPTLATVLRGAGYRTIAVHSAFPVSGYFGLTQGFDVVESFESRMFAGEDKDKWDVQRFQRRSDETTDLVLGELAKSDEPYFLWIHYWDPHDGMKLPPEELLPEDLWHLEDGAKVPTREQYEAEVRFMDGEIGRLVEALRESGAWERTLALVVADHGQGLGDHGWQHHRILYQEQIRVPLLVRVPDAAHVAEVGELVRTTDLFPTVLDYAGVAASRPVDGRSLRRLIAGERDEPRLAFADQINGYDRNAGMIDKRPLDDFLYCVLDRDWKLIYRPANPEASELYDLARDPGETRNLYRERRDQALRLERELAKHGGWVTEPFAALGSGAGDSEAAQRALRSLGYVGGSMASQDWAWTCPEHREHVASTPGTCPLCSSPLLLTRPPD